MGFYLEDGRCHACEIPGCTDCESATVCNSCVFPQYSTVDGLGCNDPIPGCMIPPGTYPIQDGEYYCPQCKDNQSWDFTNHCCDSCDVSIHPACTKCQDGYCFTCGDDFINTYDRTSCEPIIANCAVPKEEYTV